MVVVAKASKWRKGSDRVPFGTVPLLLIGEDPTHVIRVVTTKGRIR